MIYTIFFEEVAQWIPNVHIWVLPDGIKHLVIPAEAGIQTGQTPLGWHIYYIDIHKLLYHLAEVV